MINKNFDPKHSTHFMYKNSKNQIQGKQATSILIY